MNLSALREQHVRLVDDAARAIVVLDDVLSRDECDALIAQHRAAAPVLGEFDNVLPYAASDVTRRLASVMSMAFGEQLVREFSVLSCHRPGSSMHAHADNVKWDGERYVDNHTPQRTHTAVVFLNDVDGGETVFGANEGAVARYRKAITPKTGRMHAHPCGEFFHHSVSPASTSRYALVCWFNRGKAE